MGGGVNNEKPTSFVLTTTLIEVYKLNHDQTMCTCPGPFPYTPETCHAPGSLTPERSGTSVTCERRG